MLASSLLRRLGRSLLLASSPSSSFSSPPSRHPNVNVQLASTSAAAAASAPTRMASTAASARVMNLNAASNGIVPNEAAELPLTVRTMNPYVREVEYAVRGPIVTRAAEIERELAAVRSLSLSLSLSPRFCLMD